MGMQRVLVAGITGSGKTTFAREVSRRADLPFHEMDALYHGPEWTPIPSFAADVAAIAAGERWVFDSHGYEEVRDLVWSRADSVVWLAYPRLVAAARVTRRSLNRALGREPIFNGNTETLRDWLDPEHPVQWVWSQYDLRRADLEARFADPAYAGIRRVRLQTPAAARRWLDVALPLTSRG
jgi:adenylate kinase family enzyme